MEQPQAAAVAVHQYPAAAVVDYCLAVVAVGWMVLAQVAAPLIDLCPHCRS